MFNARQMSHMMTILRLNHALSVQAIDWDYYCNPSNLVTIANNIMRRKVSCDMHHVINQLQKLQKCESNHDALKEELEYKLLWFPNKCHPRVLQNESQEPVTIERVGKKTAFTYFPAHFDSLTKRLNVLRTKNLGYMSGHKSYYLKGDLAILEQALVRYSLRKLAKKGFQMVSVPDIISKYALEGCGMRSESKHSLIYHLDESWGKNLCLSGTAEMALASYVSSKILKLRDLPLKFCSASRCFRAEANTHHKERGIFRVHQFTKVEMFGITENSEEKSEALLQEFIQTQKEIYSELGLHFKILEMPPCELGLPAYHKIDMETWIPTQKLYGEISSASNCTDYQSRRLNIKYESGNGREIYCHTVNGTACAVPRLLIAFVENFQNLDGSINVPAPLQEYLKKDVIKDKFIEKIVCMKPVK